MSALQKLLSIAGDDWDASGDINANLIKSTNSFICPASEGNFSDPDDCSIYYQCAHGTSIKQFCHAGLMWNTRTNQCDWPDNVNCQLNGSQPPFRL